MAPNTPSTALKSTLVLGGCGYMGSHIVQALLNDPDCESVAVVSRNPTVHCFPQVTYYAADASDEDEMRAIFNKVQPQVVFYSSTTRTSDTEANQHLVNVDGTRVVLKLAKECPATCAFVYTSTDSTMVPSPDVTTEENAEVYDSNSDTWAYNKTKALGDTLVRSFNCPELRTACLRLCVVYGERDHFFTPGLWQTIQKGEQRMQIGDNKKLFEFVYAGNAAHAHVLAAKALVRSDASNGTTQPKVDGEAFLISDGQPMPLFSFMRSAFAVAGHPVTEDQVTTIPFTVAWGMATAGEVASFVTLGVIQPTIRRFNVDYMQRGCHWSLEKAKTRLGYEPVISREEGLRKAMEWAMTAAKSESLAGDSLPSASQIP